MHHFEYHGDEMYCEETPLAKIAEEVGTPAYVYSHATLTRHFNAFNDAFADADHLVCYSVKANGALAVLKLFADMGGGFDIVSGGELFRVLKAGGDPRKVVYSGVGKARAEIELALKHEILMFNIESSDELEAISAVAHDMGTTARVALRINPDVDPKTHPYIATGMRESKFGFPMDDARAMYAAARDLPNIDVVGIDCHIGSQLTQLHPFTDAMERVLQLLDALRRDGFAIKYLDFGGGLGIPYKDEEPPHPREYGRAITRMTAGADVTLVFEPGRVIVGNAGVMLMRTLYNKRTPAKHFIIVDAGMNDCIRPSLYSAYQQVLPVTRKQGETVTADVVGPVCESGDFFAKDREFVIPETGDLYALMSSGAYGFVMASQYNARPRPPEVLVKGGEYVVIRERETYDDLIRGERIPESA